MQARTFNSHFPVFNEEWVSQVLGIPMNYGNGPDLIGDDILVEVKFRCIDQREYLIWCVLEKQVDYPTQYNKEGYWAFGSYKLNQPIGDILSIEELDMSKIERELFVLPWSFIKRFPVHNSSGKTRQTQWKRELRYPRANQFPKLEQHFSWYSSTPVYVSKEIDANIFPRLM